MNNKILLTFLILFAVVISAGTIYASDVNVADSYATNLVDDTSDVSVPMENTADSSEISVVNDSIVDDSSKVSLSSEEVLESENSNTLSTNTENNVVSAETTTKNATQLTSLTTSIYYKSPFSITLKDANGNALAGKTVNFVINGKSYSSVTNSNGVASVSLSLTPGKYTSTVSFAGDDGNEASTVSSNINILATIKSGDVTKYYKGSAKYTATFLNSQGKTLANTNVKVTVNGKSYTVKTNSKGVASLAVNLKPGTYKVVATDPVTGYTTTNTFKVLSTITASDISKVYTDGKKFTAKFLKSNGKALAKKTIKFKINGKTYKVKTNNNGVASLSLTTLKKGTYKIISYNTDGLTKTNKVKVVKSTTTSLTASDYTFLKSDSKTIKVKLLNKFGYAPEKGKIITFKVNGKKYTAKTNANGIAKLKLPSLANGVYTVKYSFAKTNFYKASSTSSKVTIIPSKTPTFTVKSTTTFGQGAGTPFKVALTSGSVPLAKQTVTLKVDGKSYTKTTDSNGIVSLPINLAIGKYTITYTNKAVSKVNSKTSSTAITVKERAPTKLTWKSGSSFYQGVQTYKVLLQNSNNKALTGKPLKLTVNSKTYTATTDSSGIAKFNANVAPGNYTVSFKYEATGDNDYAPSSGTAKISVEKKAGNGYGYWVYGEDMNSVNLKNIASQGASDIFLNYYAVDSKGTSAVESWIAQAASYGIRVHIWMQTFYSNNDWVNSVKNGKPNTDHFNTVINKAQTYAKLKGVSGIHFDYLRYPGTAYKTSGGTAAISEFVKQACTALHDYNLSLIVSCAIMPETTNNAYYYGQDFTVISKYMDVVIPMVYKGNYGKTSSWITTTTKWFVDNSEGAKIWTGLTGYESDSDVTKLSLTELTKDSQAALDGKAAGVVIFRIGTTNFVDFNSLTDQSDSPSTTGSVTVADIVNAAYTLNNTIKSSGKIPLSVSVAGVSYSTAQFLYMMTKAVEYINAGKTSAEILPVECNVPTTPSSTAKSGNLELSEYLDLATRVSSFIVDNGAAPNYASSSLGNIKYQTLVDAFAKILAFDKAQKRLPEYVTINVNADSDTTTKTISIKNIVTGATNLKSYYEKNKALPSTVTAGGVTFKLPEFLYLMAQAIYQIGNDNSKDIAYITGVSVPSSPSSSSGSGDWAMANYLTVSKNVVTYITNNKQAPNYASTKVGDVGYNSLVDAFSRILAFYGTNARLPSYVTMSGGSDGGSISGKGINEKNTETSLSKYLAATTNCQVKDSTIVAKAAALTKGLTTDKAKATAIFNWVRDTLSYSFYYNTKYGAVNTLKYKTGNCVDHSHLLVALYRAAGLPARYVHGTCKFSSGSTYGHVWAQVLVGDTWYVADATSSKNSLGSVSNWNTKSFTLNGIYSSLSF